MCLEDIVISRQCYVKETQMLSTVTAVLEPNPDRIAVRIGTTVSGLVNAAIATTLSDAEALVGIKTWRLVTTVAGDVIGQLEMVLDRVCDGPLVQGKLFIRVNGQNCKIYETIMMPELAKAVRRRINKLLDE